MTNALGGARSDDCGSLKEAGLAYAALEVGLQSLAPAIAFKSPKDASRGFLHPQLGRLLCPAKHLTDFDSDTTEYVLALSCTRHFTLSRFLQKLQDGRVVVTSQDLPTFLYENGEYDPLEMDSGLCRSGILVRVCLLFNWSSLRTDVHIDLAAHFHITLVGY